MLPRECQELFGRAIEAQRGGDVAASMALLQQGIDACPRSCDAQFALAEKLIDFGRLNEAIDACRTALAARANFPEAHNRIGIILMKQGRSADALSAFRQALELSLGFSAAHSNLLLAMHYAEELDPDALFAEHLEWSRRHATAPRIAHTAHDRDPRRRLRLGYVSGDFYQHPISYFIEPILCNHDRSQFEVFCYSDTLRPDATTQRLRNHPLAWREVTGASDDQVIESIRDDRIDILIDLAGHTSRNRMPMFARKPAPVQVTYLGYPDTTGLAEMDFRITDAIADPLGVTDRLHREKLVRLPATAWCYRAPRVTPEVNGEQLQPGVVTFASFNNLAKLTPAWLDTWCEILKLVPNSRLLLKRGDLRDEATRKRLEKHLAAAGVDPSRLMLLGVDADHLMHLAAYGLVDIALDTFPYNGTTTTCESLWMGVPVVTLAGAVHVSRVGASLLNTVKLGGLVAQSRAQYLQIAARLAMDDRGRATLRRTLRDRVLNSPLMDELIFVAHFERALRGMWRAWCA